MEALVHERDTLKSGFYSICGLGTPWPSTLLFGKDDRPVTCPTCAKAMAATKEFLEKHAFNVIKAKPEPAMVPLSDAEKLDVMVTMISDLRMYVSQNLEMAKRERLDSEGLFQAQATGRIQALNGVLGQVDKIANDVKAL